MGWFKATVTQEMALRYQETLIAVNAESLNQAYEKVKSYTDQDRIKAHIDCQIITNTNVCDLQSFGKIDLLLA